MLEIIGLFLGAAIRLSGVATGGLEIVGSMLSITLFLLSEVSI